MTKVFLSYRREDSADIAGRIFDHLERRFGREALFLDVDTILYGDDFRRRIGEALDQTGVLLAIIGDRWLNADAAGHRRLDDPDDYVSIEISSALDRGIPVVPVLVGAAEMPKAGELPARLADLAYRNAAEVRSGRDFQFHINRLIDAIGTLLTGSAEGGASRHAPAPSTEHAITFKTLEGDPNRLVGVRLGAFVVERLLAAGGSGIAYIARNPRTGQSVCVKVSLPVLSDMEGIRRALSRGIRGLVALNHPHIVRVHEFDTLDLQDARSFYVVMDYVDGVLLNQWAPALPKDRNGLRDFLRVAFLIARALEAAHACRYFDDAGFETVGVMHGDVKPSNILVRADGTPAITDFMMVDIHRALDPAARERLTRTVDAITAVFGTPGFMAPEQEREGIVSVRTDIYGLGATLRSVAGGLPLPMELTSLFDAMTGPTNTRPRDMGEVADILSDIARREGVACEEMTPGRASGATSTYSEIPSIFQLRVLTGPHAGTVCPLEFARFTVGRSEHNNLVLPREPSLSRSHFALNWSAERRTFVVVDFGAKSPVLINSEPLAGSLSLTSGDLLTVGSTQLIYERTDPSRATT